MASVLTPAPSGRSELRPRRLRIAQLGKYYAPVTGGVEDYVRRSAKALTEEFEVKVFCMRRGPGAPVEESIDGVPVFRAGSLGAVWRQEIPYGLGAALAAWRPDVVHFHAPNPLVAAFLGSWRHGARLVVTHHADLSRPPPLRQLAWRYYRKVLQAARSIIVFTRTYADHSIELADFQDKVTVLPHGVDPAEFGRRGHWTTLQRIGFLGRLEKWKGLDLLLELARRRPDLEVHLAGTGSYGERLRNRIDALGLSGRVVLRGEVKSVQRAEFLRSLDALVLPSLSTSETFGIVLLEAQLCGVPVVASDLPTGVAEIAAHSRFGWLFRPGEVGALGATLDRLEQNPAAVRLVVENAYRNAMERYTAPVVASGLREVLRKAALA